MGNVNTDVLAGIRTNFQAIFQEALGARQNLIADVQKVATRVPSTAEYETYSWFGMVPPMEEWKDTRKLQALQAYSYTLKNKDWANGLEVDRNAIADDRLGQYPPRIRALATAYYRRVVKEVFELLDSAHTSLAYDGTAMCVDTRTIGKSGNIDNYLSGNYSDSETEIRTAIGEGLAAMTAYQDDYGDPLNLQPDAIVCAPGMRLAIIQALNPGVAGVMRPEAAVIPPERVIGNPYIDTAAKDWFLLCTSEEIKPIILQDRQAPQFASLDQMTDTNAFMQKKFFYGVDARFVVGFGDPRTVIMFHNT